MKLRSHIKILLLFAVVALSATSCYDYGDNREICDYKVQIRYHYNQENSTLENMLEKYVFSIVEYIFDEQGILYAIKRIVPDPCGDGMKSELDLLPGRYSVIAWGNLNGKSHINDARIGVTSREDMLLTLDNPCPVYAGYHDNSERLYYGYQTFSVEPKGISRIRVDMLHAHLVLKYRVTWNTSIQPPIPGEYQMRMHNNPSEYGFIAEYISYDGLCREHDPLADDRYHKVYNGITHHIPSVLYTNVLHHRSNTNIDVDKKVEGEIVAYRLRNETPTLMSLYDVTGTESDFPEQVMKEIDLKSYFTFQGIDLDRTLKQEYSLEFIINENGSVTVHPFSISDWVNGGYL